MSEPASPREVFARLHERVRDDYDMDGQADLYAVDGVLDLPFAPSGMPHRIRGREAIRALLAAAGQRARQAGRKITRYDPLVIHDTADPEVIIAEFDLHGEVTPTGAVYRMPFIQVLRVRNGEIVSMRDYFTSEVFDVAFEASQGHEATD
ncbi:MAG: nuclear transport factor 2 family protein [Nitrososphaerota archaeon]